MTAWTNLTSAGLLQTIIWRGRPLANERSGAGTLSSSDLTRTWLLCVQAIIWFLVEFKTHLPFKQTQFSLLQLSDVLALYNWPHIQSVLTVSRAMFVETGRYTGKTHLHSMQWHTGRYRHELMHSYMHFSTLCSSASEISSFSLGPSYRIIIIISARRPHRPL